VCSLTVEYEEHRRFVTHWNFEAVTRSHQLFAQPDLGTWKLLSELPDTDAETGAPMDDATFTSRWQRQSEVVLKHLMKKHEGEVRQFWGKWSKGKGEIHPNLYDPQFALTHDDYLRCKGKADWGKGKSIHQRDYDIMSRCHGKGKDKDEGKQHSKGDEDEHEFRFENRVLRERHDGSWEHMGGMAVSLPQLFLSLGHLYTAAELYGYFNTLEPLCVKRPHAWASPVRQVAAAGRWRESNGRGRGFGR